MNDEKVPEVAAKIPLRLAGVVAEREQKNADEVTDDE